MWEVRSRFEWRVFGHPSQGINFRIVIRTADVSVVTTSSILNSLLESLILAQDERWRRA